MTALADLKSYLDTTLGGDLPADAVLSGVLAAELSDQFFMIRNAYAFPGLGETDGAWEAHPAPLREAVLRRCARNLALRKSPLGIFGTEVPVRVGQDPEVRRLEAPFRRLPVG